MVERRGGGRRKWTGSSSSKGSSLPFRFAKAAILSSLFTLPLFIAVLPSSWSLISGARAAPAPSLPPPHQQEQHQPESISLQSLQGHLIGGNQTGDGKVGTIATVPMYKYIVNYFQRIIVTGALDAGGFITTEKKAHLSGLRVEPDELGELGDEGFIGYT